MQLVKFSLVAINLGAAGYTLYEWKLMDRMMRALALMLILMTFVAAIPGFVEGLEFILKRFPPASIQRIPIVHLWIENIGPMLASIGINLTEYPTEIILGAYALELITGIFLVVHAKRQNRVLNSFEMGIVAGSIICVVVLTLELLQRLS